MADQVALASVRLRALGRPSEASPGRTVIPAPPRLALPGPAPVIPSPVVPTPMPTPAPPAPTAPTLAEPPAAAAPVQRPPTNVSAAAKSAPRVTTGWVRMLTLPSCSRCALLAGKFYRWNDGFLRHIGCDCRHVPVTGPVADTIETNVYAYFESLSTEQQNKLFGVANSEAIRRGADISRVINASTRPGAMSIAGNRRRTTAELARGSRDRPTPWQIFQDANGNADEAVKLLTDFGYILPR
jgi:hypothetical protein